MTREEAIKVVRNIYQTDAEKEALETLFTELAESEDERIIDGFRILLDGIKRSQGLTLNKVPLDKCYSWLKKQKESLHIQETCEENANSFADGIIEVRSFQRGMEEGRRLEKQKEQKPVECIEFDNEFEKQVSHLLASVLNGEWEYNEGFVKHAAQSLLGFAKNEMKPDEWDKREKLFRKALQAANARIGQLLEENQKLKEQKLEKYAQRLQKEQKQAQTSDEKEYVRTIKSIISDFIRDKKPENLAYYQRIYDWLDGRHVPFSCGHENGKPTEWDNLQEEFRNINEAFEDGKKEVINHPDKYGLTKPAEWSEEDEHRRDGIIQWLREYQEKFNPEYDSLSIESIESLIDWLKSIPEKFNLQSKQECGKVTINGEPVSAENYSVDIPLAEWSKEDEKDIAHIIRILDDCYAYGKHDLSKTDHENLVNKLKSLRPSWKPSEEQMDRLSSIVAALRKDYCDDMADFLASIYHNLKKLM